MLLLFMEEENKETNKKEDVDKYLYPHLLNIL